MKKPFFLFLPIVLVFGCSRDKTPSGQNSDPNIVVKTDKAMIILTELVHLSEAARNETLGMTGYVNDTSGCPTITWDSTGTAYTINIDYNYSDHCLCQDGQPRSGDMTISYNGDDHAIGTTIVHQFGQLSSLLWVNQYTISGTQSIINKGPNAQGHFCQDLDMNITMMAFDYIIITADLSLEWKEGWNTPDPMDDVLLITGQLNAAYDPPGSHAENKSCVVNIQVPLEKRASCRYFSGGKVLYNVQGMQDHLLYYGEGTCDNQAVLQVNNRVEIIQLLD